MRKTLLLVALFVFTINESWSLQKGDRQDSVLNREIQLIVDNDVFLFVGQDRYYSSGIYVKYRRLIGKGRFGYKPLIPSVKFEKSIVTYSFHQKMFTPYNVATVYEPVVDRPYAGWLDLGLGLDYLYTHALLNFRFDVGWMGPANQTEDVQVLLHDVLNLKTPKGWGEFQVKDRPAVQFKTEYLKKIFGNGNIDVTGEAELNMGSIVNTLKGGVNIRIGFFSEIKKSFYSGGKMGQKRIKPSEIHTNDRTQELYFFFNTSTRYVLYDATIEGNLVGGSDKFKNTAESMIQKQMWGLVRSGRYFDFSVVVNVTSPEIIGNQKHKYVTIGLSYRL